MKITGTTTSQPHTRDQRLSSGDATNFQQLVQQLEQDMWPGAKAGRNDVRTLPKPGNVPARQPPAQQPVMALSAQDAAIPSDAALATVDASLRAEPALASLITQATPAAIPMLQAKQSNNDTLAPTPQPFPALQAHASNAAKANVIEPSTAARTPQQATPAANEGDRLNLLPGTTMPALVVRYTGRSEELPLLKRALQDMLRRHGINDTSLTINGFDAIARIEHGADHGR